jgi:hypothetical protein
MMLKKTLAALLIAGALCGPVQANDNTGLIILGGVLGGIIINEAMQPRVYVQPQPHYRREYIPAPMYYAPPVYYRYRPAPVCNLQFWYDDWGNQHAQRVCY